MGLGRQFLKNLIIAGLISSFGVAAFAQCVPGQMTHLIAPTKAQIDQAGHTLPVQANVQVHVLGERDNKIFFYVTPNDSGRYISAVGATPYQKAVLACQKG